MVLVVVLEMALIWNVHDLCRKQIEPEIGEIPVAFVAKTEGSDLSEDDIKQFVSKEVLLLKTSKYKKDKRNNYRLRI